MRQESIHHRDHLLIQMQPWSGPRLAKEGLVPPPPAQRSHPHFGYVGDLQLSFSFRPASAAQPVPVSAQDLNRLGLTPGRAVAVATANVRRLAGEPQFIPLGSRVQALRCALPECTATGLLDRAVWLSLLEKYPQGLIAALPRRGLFMYVPAGDPEVEDEIGRRAAKAYANAANDRLSACLYRFSPSGWQAHAELADYMPSPVGNVAAEAGILASAPAKTGLGQNPFVDSLRLGVARLSSSMGLRSARITQSA